MRIASVCLLTLSLGIFIGCVPQTVNTAPPQINSAVKASAENSDLIVSIRLPKSRFVIGEDVPITIVATNRSKGGLRFSNSTSAPYRIHLEKTTPLGWTTVKTYPEAAAMVLVEWSIPPGQHRTIHTTLIAERDWPTYENLRLRANLPGRPDVAPFVYLEVVPAK